MNLRGYRTLVIENTEKLSFDNNHIILNDDDDASLPVPQFENVLFSTQRTSVSVKLLNQLINRNAMVVFCDILTIDRQCFCLSSSTTPPKL